MFFPEDEQKNDNPPANEEPAAAKKKAAKSDTGDEAKKASPDKKARSEGKVKPEKKTGSKKKSVEKSDKAEKAAEKDKALKSAKSGKKKDKKEAAPVQVPSDYIPRLKRQYWEKIVPALVKRFSYKNVMMAPRLEKIVLNVGIGEASQNPKLLESAVEELAAIAGQRPSITRARKSISNFKLRAGMPVGCRVTLRGWRMWEFLDRLMSIAIPRIRDFRGLSDRSFDGRGSYTFGIREQIIFPEIDIDKIERVHGMDITLVTTAKSDEEAYALLEEMGWPFRRRRQTQTSEQEA
jgi:large subunit ribosomal protein L5